MRATTRNLLVLLLVFGGVLLVAATWPLWNALIVATLIAILLDPPVSRLERRLGGRRGLAAGLVYLAAVVVLGGLLWIIGVLIWGQVPAWTRELQEALSQIGQWLERPFTILGYVVQPQRVLDYLEQAATSTVSALPLGTGGLFGGIASNLLWALVTLVGLYYLLRDGPRIAPSLVAVVPAPYQASVRQLLDELTTVWRVFLRVQLIIFAILGVLVLASTMLIIWLFRQGWLPLSPFGLLILLILVYAAIQQVDNLWLRPQYMGGALKLHPGVAMIALIAALALSGVLGALIVIPALASARVVLRYLMQWTARPDEAAAADSRAGRPPSDQGRPRSGAAPDLESGEEAQAPAARETTGAY